MKSRTLRGSIIRGSRPSSVEDGLYIELELSKELKILSFKELKIFLIK